MILIFHFNFMEGGSAPPNDGSCAVGIDGRGGGGGGLGRGGGTRTVDVHKKN